MALVRVITATMVLIVLGWNSAPLPAAAAEDLLQQYYGKWVGVGVTADADLQSNPVMVRDTDLEISRTDDGFRISWTTLVSRAKQGKKARTKSTVLDFSTGAQPTAFKIKSAKPPLEAGADAWAEVKNGRLVIYLSDTSKSGVKRVSRYERLAHGNEMTLEYTLSENDKIIRNVSGNLVRLKR